MPAALSIESQVDRLRVEVGCESRGDFILLARALGAPISASEYSLAMRDLKVLDRRIWEKLLDIVTRMKELQDSVAGVPVNWSRTDACVNAMVTRMLSNVANEMGLEKRDEYQAMARAAADRAARMATN